jgi:sortase A
VFKKKPAYYHVDDKPKARAKSKRKKWPLLLALVMFGAGAYLLVLLQSPEIVPQASASPTEEKTLIGKQENFIKIERLNLLVPFYTGDSELTLEKGAWHRFPERGDPEKGGNFILSAHRFRLGITPNETKERSPFYHLDKLQEKDTVDIYFKGQWYSYQVQKMYSVKPDAVEIEEPSEEAKLTIYSCSLKGSADGRVVIEAKPLVRAGQNSDPTDAPLL